MKEHPILFSAPMVRAILDDSKTQTRRIAKVTPDQCEDIGLFYAEHLCAYGQPGDRLWVRETYRFLNNFDGDKPSTVGELCVNAGYPKPWAPKRYEADGATDNWIQVGTPTHPATKPTPGKLRPSIHMPRWASRINLEITGVRVERLQDISEADAEAEGCTAALDDGPTFYDEFASLWRSINGPGSWALNPWVWVIEFKRVTE